MASPARRTATKTRPSRADLYAATAFVDQLKRPEDLSVRESIIEQFFVQQAKQWGCDQFKILFSRAWPDRALLWPCGVTDYIELKRPKGGRFEVGQLRLHEHLRKRGHTVEVLNTKALILAYFKHRAAILHVQRKPTLSKLARSGLLCATDIERR